MPVLNHPQQLVTVKGRSAEVDVGLAPLIETLWRLGIGTQFSCQGNRRPDIPPTDASNWGQILFSDVEDLRRFMNLFGGTALSPRRFHISKLAPTDDQCAAMRWTSRIMVEPAGSIGTDAHLVDSAALCADHVQIRAEVRFPSSDLAAMTRIVSRFAASSSDEESNPENLKG